jgi:hypothetical protein
MDLWSRDTPKSLTQQGKFKTYPVAMSRVLDSGLAVARGALSLVWEGGKLALRGGQDVHLIHVVIAGLLARAQGFHEGAVAAIEADNP